MVDTEIWLGRHFKSIIEKAALLEYTQLKEVKPTISTSKFLDHQIDFFIDICSMMKLFLFLKGIQ